jgi:hypothetical protein
VTADVAIDFEPFISGLAGMTQRRRYREPASLMDRQPAASFGNSVSTPQADAPIPALRAVTLRRRPFVRPGTGGFAHRGAAASPDGDVDRVAMMPPRRLNGAIAAGTFQPIGPVG